MSPVSYTHLDVYKRQEEIERDSNNKIYVVCSTDKYGDNGLISVVILRENSCLLYTSGNYASDEAKEIARLKRELRDAQDALDVLKKADVYKRQVPPISSKIAFFIVCSTFLIVLYS